jgi:ABC-type transporter Mla subunit MlaD
LPHVIAMVQADPALVEYLNRIAVAQTIMAVVALLLVVAAAIGLMLSFRTLKRLARTLQSLDKVVDELAPRAEPLIDGLTRSAVDAAAVTEAVRRKVNDVLDTVEDVNGRLRDATASAEQRIRQFGAVLDIVQTEAEDMLLEAASTARGVHTAARALREPSPQSRGNLPRTTEEVPNDT